MIMNTTMVLQKKKTMQKLWSVGVKMNVVLYVRVSVRTCVPVCVLQVYV